MKAELEHFHRMHRASLTTAWRLLLDAETLEDRAKAAAILQGMEWASEPALGLLHGPKREVAEEALDEIKLLRALAWRLITDNAATYPLRPKPNQEPR